jgi:hypothetical protein
VIVGSRGCLGDNWQIQAVLKLFRYAVFVLLKGVGNVHDLG